MGKNKKPKTPPPAPDLNAREIRQREEAERPDAAEVLALYAKNLDEIRRWFRNSSTPGIERGHVVLGEMFFTLSTEALAFALKGESWSPGNRLP